MAVARRDVEPPLVDVRVTNPVTYIRRWWNRVIGNEGMELRFKVRPLTAMAMAFVVTSLTLGVGQWAIPWVTPWFKEVNRYGPVAVAREPTATPDPWRETAFTGTLQYAGEIGKYYLITTASEAINLEVPGNIELAGFVGRRIFAAGRYNKSARTLVVASAGDMELLPRQPMVLPTVTGTLTPVPSAEPTAGSQTEI